MQVIDYIVIGVVLLSVLIIGLAFARRAGRSTEEYILGGRKMPWWLGGISIVATALNASSMLLETRKIRQDGISGQWYTWNQVIGGLINAVWFSRLWRRARFTTPMEFYLARYSGWQAHFARLFDVALFALLLSTVWSAVGLVGMKKIIQVATGFPPMVTLFGLGLPTDWVVVAVLVIVTMVYTVCGGVHGVVWTDLVEFIIAMVVSYALMFIVYREAGWAPGLRKGFENLGSQGDQLLRWLPVFGPILIYYFFISPLTGLGHVGPSIQRFLCVKDEREVLFTALFSTIGSYLIKSWPFYVAGLCGVVLVSDADLLARFSPLQTPEGHSVADYEMLLPLMVERYLPPGLVGLMIAAFMCAFMSSFAPNIHNSASNFIHDVLRAYVVPGRPEAFYVRLGRIYSVVLGLAICVVAITVHDILKLNMFAAALLVSSGFVKLLRFTWWRINGTAEVAAQITSVLSAGFFLSPAGHTTVVRLMGYFEMAGNDGFFVLRQSAILSIGTAVAVVAALITKPEPMGKLGQFYRLIRPFGFWRPVRISCGLLDVKADSYGLLITLTISTNLLFFGALFGIFALFLGYWAAAFGMMAISVVGIFGTWWTIQRLYPQGGGDQAEVTVATNASGSENIRS